MAVKFFSEITFLKTTGRRFQCSPACLIFLVDSQKKWLGCLWLHIAQYVSVDASSLKLLMQLPMFFLILTSYFNAILKVIKCWGFESSFWALPAFFAWSQLGPKKKLCRLSPGPGQWWTSRHCVLFHYISIKTCKQPLPCQQRHGWKCQKG